MNRKYVLNNLLDGTLYCKDAQTDTRNLNESKQFPNRQLANQYIEKRNLTEKYSVKSVSDRFLKESIDKDEIVSEIESAIDDTKDMIDMTLEFVETYKDSIPTNLDEDIFDGSNIEDVLDRLRKLKKGAMGINFRPSFYDSDGSGMVPDLGKADDVPKEIVSNGGETNA